MNALLIICTVGWLFAISAGFMLMLVSQELLHAARTNQSLLKELQETQDSVRFWMRRAGFGSDAAHQAVLDLERTINEEFGKN